MTDCTDIINDLLSINDTMFALGTSNKNIDNISIRMAFDKNWHNIAERAATTIEELQAEVKRLKEVLDRQQKTEGHGRLVDADALIELMLERKRPLIGADSSKDRYRYMQWLADFNAIKDAKTIVPAERSEI